MKKMKKGKLSNIVALHYLKLVLRSGLLIGAVCIYLYNRFNNTGELFGVIGGNYFLISLIWIVFVAEMILRFFPSRFESMGCQKQFARNYIEKVDRPSHTKIQSGKTTAIVAVSWLALNTIIGILYYLKLIDAGILLLISLAFSVCDVVCILFFCPFQTWFMKNKCCTTCRIYNWDYAMMFTPLIFIPNIYTWSLLGLAFALLVKWEFLVHKHPEWFSEQCNEALSCANCQEKLCHQKKQLRKFLKSGRFNLVGNALFKKNK